MVGKSASGSRHPHPVSGYLLRCGVAGVGLAFAAAVSSPAALAQGLPTGAEVHAGQASLSLDGPQLNVRQSTPTAIVSWETFSIGQPNGVHFDNGAGSTLNRVRGNVASQIDGSLTATGSLYLVNPAGIAVGPTGRIGTGGSFVGTTLGLADEEFEKAARGEAYTLKGDSAATVRNAGRIGSLGGDVVLVGREVENAGGDISAPNGTAALAAGSEVLAQDRALDGGRFVVKAGGSGTRVRNTGNIKAAEVELRANGGNVYALAGNRAGVIAATGTARRGGRVFLTAGDAGTVEVTQQVSARGAERAGRQQRDGGEIRVSGKSVRIAATLDASGRAPSVLPPARPSVADGDGGLVIVTGQSVTLADAARVDVSGAKGGVALVGGDFQGGADAANNYVSEKVATAKALAVAKGATVAADGAGDGGRIVLWSDERTDFAGHVSATSETGTGGDAEVSGKAVLSFTGTANLLGPSGAGTLLLDPYDLEIVGDPNGNIVEDSGTFTSGAGTSQLNVNTLTAALSGASVVVKTGGSIGDGQGSGDITVNAAITWNAATTLTLSAHRNIIVNESITAQDAGGKLRLRADSTGTGDGVVTFGGGAQINLPGVASLDRVKIYHNGAPDVNVAQRGADRIFAGNAADPSDPGDLNTFSHIQTYKLVHDVDGLKAIGEVVRTIDHDGTLKGSHGHYALSRDIDLGNVPWTPIKGAAGSYVPEGFSGMLDGLGHAIRNINVSATAGDHQGLFAQIDNGYVQNLILDTVTIHAPNSDHVGALAGVSFVSSVVNVHANNISVVGRDHTGGLIGRIRVSMGANNLSANGAVAGGNYVGGLAGSADSVDDQGTDQGWASLLDGAFATGSVTGTDNVGGLVGRLQNHARIANAYATSAVHASGAIAGGLVGLQETHPAQEIKNAYATGRVTGGSNLGGLVGRRISGTITDSFWDVDTTGLSVGVGLGDSTGAAALHSRTAGNSAFAGGSYVGWTFTDNDPWYIADGETRPLLRFALDQAGKTWDSVGNLTNTYTIRTAEQLQLIKSHEGADSNGRTYILANDIDFAAALTNSSVWRTQATQKVGAGTARYYGFLAIGTTDDTFQGTFDGRGHVISGLTIHRNTADFNELLASGIGLFGVANDATIGNIGLRNAAIVGSAHVGALVGAARGTTTIANAWSSGSVTAAVNVAGGLIGSDQENFLVDGGSGNVSITNAYSTAAVLSGLHVGGLAGLFYGDIERTWASGSVNGAIYTGGLVGTLHGTIKDSYATGNVHVSRLNPDTADEAGGLVGTMEAGSTIERAYASGLVTSAGNVGTAFGGLVGRRKAGAGAITASFWDSGSTGQSGPSPIGTDDRAGADITNVSAVTSADAYTQGTYTGANFGFTDNDPWYIVDGETRPLLRMTLDALGRTRDGAGNLTNTYTIHTAEALQLIRAHTDTDAAAGKTYILGRDIDFGDAFTNASSVWRTATTAGANGYGFVPIGTSVGGQHFGGTFDGRGHVIRGLTIHRPNQNFVGLFGWTWGGTIRNVGLENVQVTGKDSTGGLSGVFGHSSIANVWISGNVKGGEYTGGLVGTGDVTEIEHARSSANVVGTNHVGGLVGSLESSGSSAADALKGSYASGTVTGDVNVGGLVGWSLNSTITDSYATGSVTAATHYGGGLVGYLGTGGTIARTYATGLVTGGAHLGGLVGGRRWDAGTITASFWDWQRAGSRVSNAIGEDLSAAARDTTALTTAQFRNTAYFVNLAGAKGWNFNTTWAPPDDHHLPELYALSKVIRVHSSGTVDTTYGDAAGAWAGAGTVTVYGGSQYVFGSTDYGTHAAFDYNAAAAQSGLRLNAGAYGVAQVRGLNVNGANGYRFVYTAGLDVAKRDLVITANDAAKIYDGAAWSGADGVAYNGFASGETESVLGGALVWSGSAQGAQNAGTYTIAASGLTSRNYAIHYVDGTLNIAKAALTVTAHDAAKTYDGAAWAGGSGVTYSGFVGGDTASVLGGTLVYGGSAQGAKNAGTYAIAAGNLTARNYEITFAEGTLTVGRAALTIGPAAGQRKIIGDDGFRIAFDATGWQGQDGPALLDGALAHEGASPGDWAITLGSLSAGSNYALMLADGARLTLIPGFGPAPTPVDPTPPSPVEPGGGSGTAWDDETIDRFIADLLNGGITASGVTTVRDGQATQIARNLQALPFEAATRVAGTFISTATVPSQRQRVTTPVAFNSDTIRIGDTGEEIIREVTTTIGTDENRPFQRRVCDTSGIGGGSGGIGSRAFVPANLRTGTCG